MPLLIPLILLYVVEVIAPHNDSPGHLCTVAGTSQNATPDGDIASKGALLVNVCSFNSISGSLKAEPNALPEAIASLSRPLALASLLGAEENLGLFEESLLRLFRHV